MSKYHSHSPFFPVRNTLKVLRFLLGFPLRPVDNTCVEFIFNPWVEYVRYGIYISIVLVSEGSFLFYCMMHGNASDPFSLTQKIFTTLGLSQLDMLVFLFMPSVNYVSWLCHFISFKNSVKHTNKICLTLSNVNQELSQSVCSTATKHCMRKQKSLALIYLGTTFGVIGIIFWICTTCGLILDGKINGHILRQANMALYVMAGIVNGLTWVYPALLIMADLFICQLLETLGEAFEKWNKILKQKKHNDSSTFTKLYVKVNIKPCG